MYDVYIGIKESRCLSRKKETFKCNLIFCVGFIVRFRNVVLNTNFELNFHEKMLFHWDLLQSTSRYTMKQFGFRVNLSLLNLREWLQELDSAWED